MQNWLGKQLHLLAGPTVTQTHTGMCVWVEAPKSARPFSPRLHPITCHPSGVTLILVDFIGGLGWLHTDTHSYVQTQTHTHTNSPQHGQKGQSFHSIRNPRNPDDPAQTLDFDRCLCLSECVCVCSKWRGGSQCGLKPHMGGCVLTPRSSISLSSVTKHSSTHTHTHTTNMLIQINLHMKSRAHICRRGQTLCRVREGEREERMEGRERVNNIS